MGELSRSDADATGADGSSEVGATSRKYGSANGDAERGSVAETRPSAFGDPVGLAVFLGALCTVGATWQVGVFITDTYAVANGLVNLADGHLSVQRVEYALTLRSQPGLSAANGHLYARNYGQAFLALPVYVALDLLGTVVDTRLLLVAAWGLVLAAFCRQLGVLAGRRRQFATAGSVLAALLVVACVPQAGSIDGQVALLALQVVSMLAVAVSALALYRLGTLVRTQRVGIAVGAGTVLATPLWFWAAIPKRHALTAAAVATLLYWFAASRDPSGRIRLPVLGAVPRSLTLRVAGYVLVGLVAWVHAYEGILLLGAFGVSDLATASGTSRRTVLVILVAVAIGFVPFFATNVAMTGDPLSPPRTADYYLAADGEFSIGPDGEVVEPGERGTGADGRPGTPGGGDDTTGGSTQDGGADAGGGESDGSVDGAPTRDPFATAVGFGEQFASHGSKILRATAAGPHRIYRTYVRSGYPHELTSYEANDHEAIELTLLESNPLFAGLGAAVAGSFLAAVAGAGRRFRRDGFEPVRGMGTSGRRVRRDWPGPALGALSPRRWIDRLREASAARRTDLFAALVTGGFGVMYFPLLPLQSQLTVRYLLPMVPALLYLLARVPAVADAVDRRPRWLAGGFVGSAAVALLAVAVLLPLLDPAVGEAMQLHALANLVVATVVAVAVALPWFGRDDARVRALALGLAGAATAALVVAMQLAYFDYGTYALPGVRLVADALAVV